MRRFPVFFFAALSLLAACSKAPRPVRLDFIGSPRFTSSYRTASPGDTLSTRLYASGDSANKSPLTHFLVTVTYSPAPNPPVYATPAVPLLNQQAAEPLVFLDSTLAVTASRQSLYELVYQMGFGARTTSGSETWVFEVKDKDNSATRSFRIRVSKPDSLAEYHQYTLRVPTAPAHPARPYVALLPGLALPVSALRASATAQNLIDLEYRAGAGSLSVYASPNTAKRTVLRQTTGIDSTGFLALNTAARIGGVFGSTNAQAFPTPTVTGPLVRNQVVAFSTVDGHLGVFIVRRIVSSPTPVLELVVRVLK